jgi:hypothetical protein
MIYTFRFISDEEESFIMDVNINHDQTFLQLHQIIQERLGFDPGQLTSFFASNESWEKLEEITLLDMGTEQAHIMENTPIEMFYHEKNERLLYVFDYLAERLLFGSITPEQTLHCDFEDDEFLMSDHDEDSEAFGYEDELPEDLEDFNPEPGNDY